MRDLASQGFRDKSNSFNSPQFVKVLGIAIVVGGLLFVIKSLFLDKSLGGGAQVLRDAPTNLKPVSVNWDGVDVEGGIDLTNQSATLADVKYGGSASATATRTFGDGSYSLSVSATLPDSKGDRYQVWLVSGASVKDAGFMEGAKSSWSLIFRDKDLYKGYNTVWITREITTEDGEPEQRVMEGTF